MKVTLIGCGGWGTKIAQKLAQRDGISLALVDERESVVRELADDLDCPWSFDPAGYLGVTGTAAGSNARGAVVIATPPDTHLEMLRAVLAGYGPTPLRVRVEKPLAINADEAEEMTRLCQEAGAHLTVGFTLLHAPLYEAAFAYLRASRTEIERIEGIRIGRSPRHRADSLIDAGIHVAAIAAHLGADADIGTAYDPSASMRVTSFFDAEGAAITVDEIAETVETRLGQINVTATCDALDNDLAAWLTGQHRGTPAVAVQAQRIIDTHLGLVAA